jgi:4-amino-4-deoxy-L-arabinose transferase-like glycosyltransferase
MTYFAVLGRLVNLGMSLGIIWVVGEMARMIAGQRAGWFAAAACALNVGLTYYGQVGNLDVPYLFWGVLSLLWAMRAVIEQQVRRWWGAALFAAAAVATKDQAYALFLLSLPLFLVLVFAVDVWSRENAKRIALTLLPAAALALVAVLLLDGAITNPAGFAKRVAFLAGPASQTYAEYWHGPVGWMALLGDMACYYARGLGLLAMLWTGMGVWLAWRRRNVAGFLPLLAIVSFTVCFNFAALRSDDRFLMPQAVLACVYIGMAVEMITHGRPWLRWGASAAVALTALMALHQAIAINAAMLFDPRYDAERWMAAHVAPGETIETYGQNCFLPRFPAGAVVTRVGQGDLKLRNPLPGVREVRDAFIAPRGAHYIVLSTAWARRYLRPAVPLSDGHTYSVLQWLDFRNTDANMYFTGLVTGKLPYRLAHVSSPNAFWPTVHIHDSLNEPVWIFERVQ